MSDQKEIESFNTRVSGLLDASNSIEIIASELTSFTWESLCFRRETLLKLTFSGGGSVREFKFNYEDYFIDEAYVEGSPDGRCISHRDRIIVKRKYPGHAQTIEFLTVSK